MNINLKSVRDITEFVNIANRFSGNIDVSSGRNSVDAKSLMGVMSLDLSRTLQVYISGERKEYIYEALKKYAA